MPIRPIYLDHAAATPVDTDVLAAMTPYYTNQFYNPSALYLAAKDVARDLSQARELVARQLGARPTEIIFTAGGTEANNLAIQGVMSQFPDANLVVSAGEHDSVVHPAEQYDCRMLNLDMHGHVKIDQLRGLIDERTVLVSVMYANNEIGSIQPINRITRLVQEIRHERVLSGNRLPLYVHTDACQAANYLILDKSRLGVDLMTLNGGKIYGPKQSGCLFVASGTQLSPQILGGGQERGMRSGTENVAQAIGFAMALAKTQAMRQAESKRLDALQLELVQKLLQLPGVVITGSLQEDTSPTEAHEIVAKHPKALRDTQGNVLPNFVHLRIAGADNERLIMELDEQGIMAAAGSACSASSDEPSRVLLAMGLSEADAQSSLRFTMGRTTTQDNINRLVKVLSTLMA